MVVNSKDCRILAAQGVTTVCCTKQGTKDSGGFFELMQRSQRLGRQITPAARAPANKSAATCRA